MTISSRRGQRHEKAYPYLEAADVRAALAYADWRAEEVEVPLAQA